MNQSTLLMHHKQRARACVTSLAIRGASVYGIVLNVEAVDYLRSPERRKWQNEVLREFARLSRRPRNNSPHYSEFWTQGPVRDLSQLFKDGFLSPSFHLKHFSEESKRLDAIVRVLCALPQEDYWEFSPINTGVDFYFCLPEEKTLGKALTDISSQRLNFIYLSHELETMSLSRVMHCVAHELSHCLAKHSWTNKTKETKEWEANNKAKRWGFPWY